MRTIQQIEERIANGPRSELFGEEERLQRAKTKRSVCWWCGNELNAEDGSDDGYPNNGDMHDICRAAMDRENALVADFERDTD